MFGCCSLVFAGFLTDLNPNEQIRHNQLVSCGRRCGDTVLRLLYQIQKQFCK